MSTSPRTSPKTTQFKQQTRVFTTISPKRSNPIAQSNFLVSCRELMLVFSAKSAISTNQFKHTPKLNFWRPLPRVRHPPTSSYVFFLFLFPMPLGYDCDRSDGSLWRPEKSDGSLICNVPSISRDTVVTVDAKIVLRNKLINWLVASVQKRCRWKHLQKPNANTSKKLYHLPRPFRSFGVVASRILLSDFSLDLRWK